MSSLITALFVLFTITYWKTALGIGAVVVCCIVLLLRRPPKFPTRANAHNLAIEAANLLERGLLIADNHAYYCGMGLAHIDGVFIYDAVQDGEICGPGNCHHGNPERKEFINKDDFVVWLENQFMSRPLYETTDICFTRVTRSVASFRKSEFIHHG